MRPWLPLPLVLLAAACGGGGTGGTTTGVLSIKQVPGRSDAMYIEGFLWNIEGHQIGGTGGFSRPGGHEQVVVTLPAGSYRLDSSVSPCDGNCGVLDSATDACSAVVEIAAGERTERVVETVPGKPCTIR